jgi:hypothetical protein
LSIPQPIIKRERRLAGAYLIRRPSLVRHAEIRQQERDAMRIAQINVEGKGGLPPPMSKGGCHGA